ncbi:MAG: hypothetical protein WA324_16640 [Bryobacteraceae bacterium]|jgi:hypothetical protein
MATLHIEIPDQKAAALKAYAQAQGLTVEKWLEQLVEQATPSSSEPPVVEDDRPIWEIFADAMKDVPREDLALLPKDGAAQIDHYLYGHPKT